MYMCSLQSLSDLSLTHINAYALIDVYMLFTDQLSVSSTYSLVMG